MANRTVKEAVSIKGTNPQYLVEKIIRLRVYESRYWKEECFALTAELLVDKAVALRYVGGIYGGNVKPTPFMCLLVKMLQIQPEKEIIMEFIRQEEFKYMRILGAVYLRLIGTSLECYKYLEPLLNDYRKVRRMNRNGHFELTFVDEIIDQMLREDRIVDITLPRLQKRYQLEENNELDPRVSLLDEDLAADDENSERHAIVETSSSDEEADGQKETNQKRQNRSVSADGRSSSDESRDRRHHRHHDSKRRRRSRSRDRDRSRDRQHKKRNNRSSHKSSSKRSKKHRQSSSEDSSGDDRRSRRHFLLMRLFDSRMPMDWTLRDYMSLFDQLRKQLPKNDQMTPIRRIQKMKLQSIFIPGKTAEDVKNQLDHLLRKVRKHRNLEDILMEFQEGFSKQPDHAFAKYICELEKPLNPRARYLSKHKDKFRRKGVEGLHLVTYSSKKYLSLPPEKKAKYEEAYKEEEARYHKQLHQALEKFIAGSINAALEESACDLYVQRRLMKHPDVDSHALECKYREKWYNMSEERRQKYLDEAKTIAAKHSNKTTNGENSYHVEESANQNPKQKRVSAYSLFIHEYVAEGHSMSEAREAWKNIDGLRLHSLKIRANEMNGTSKTLIPKEQRPVNVWSYFVSRHFERGGNMSSAGEAYRNLSEKRKKKLVDKVKAINEENRRTLEKTQAMQTELKVKSPCTPQPTKKANQRKRPATEPANKPKKEEQEFKKSKFEPGSSDDWLSSSEASPIRQNSKVLAGMPDSDSSASSEDSEDEHIVPAPISAKKPEFRMTKKAESQSNIKSSHSLKKAGLNHEDTSSSDEDSESAAIAAQKLSAPEAKVKRSKLSEPLKENAKNQATIKTSKAMVAQVENATQPTSKKPRFEASKEEYSSAYSSGSDSDVDQPTKIVSKKANVEPRNSKIEKSKKGSHMLKKSTKSESSEDEEEPSAPAQQKTEDKKVSVKKETKCEPTSKISQEVSLDKSLSKKKEAFKNATSSSEDESEDETIAPTPIARKINLQKPRPALQARTESEASDSEEEASKPKPLNASKVAPAALSHPKFLSGENTSDDERNAKKTAAKTANAVKRKPADSSDSDEETKKSELVLTSKQSKIDNSILGHSSSDDDEDFKTPTAKKLSDKKTGIVSQKSASKSIKKDVKLHIPLKNCDSSDDEKVDDKSKPQGLASVLKRPQPSKPKPLPFVNMASNSSEDDSD